VIDGLIQLNTGNHQIAKKIQERANDGEWNRHRNQPNN
jgi:hypothetical protein